MVYRTNSNRLHVLLQKIACLVGASLLVLSFLVVAIQLPQPASAATLTATVDCGNGGSPSYASAGFTIPSRSIIPGNGNNGFVNTNYVSITTSDTLTITYRNCTSSFASAYAGQEVGAFTEDCGTFSPAPTTGNVTGLTMTYTYTPLITPANSKTRAYCNGTGGAGSGDHIQYLADLSPQLTIRVSAAAPDTTAPTLSSSVPADNATSVSLSSNVALTFSETVTAVAGKNIVVKKSDGTTVETISATSAQVTISGLTATVNPASNFDYLTGYYVLIDAGAFVDGAANAYAGISSTTVLNFVSIADTAAPTLSSSTPADNATGVATASNISLVFSEDVTAVSGKNVVIKKSDGTTVETVSVTDGGRISVSGSTVTIDPTAAFLYSSSYYVLIDAGAFRDNASNAYAGISSSSALDFSVVADTAISSTSTIPASSSSTIAAGVTTTTVVVAAAISSTSTIPASSSSTIASGVTTTTVAISVTKPSAPATSVPRSVLPSNVLPVATTTTTSSTSTSTTLPPVVAPQAQLASPGTATALIAGKKVAMRVVRNNNSLEITSASIQMRLQIIDELGAIVPLDTDGYAVLSQDSRVKYSISGAEPGAELEVWLFSEPAKLGSVIVRDDGKVSGMLPIVAEVPAGDHRLVFKTRTATGDDATVSVGVIVGEIGGGVSIGSIIFGTLIAAVLAGLVIPATRRRRKTRHADYASN